MAGYLYPVGAAADTGRGNTVGALLTPVSVSVFTATAKTKINSILLTNETGGVLPVSFYLQKGEEDPTTLVRGFRVLKRRYLMQSLVSGDSRTSEPVLGGDPILTEVVLEAGDQLLASCPLTNSVYAHITYSEGVK